LNKSIYILVAFTLLQSCDFFTSSEELKPVAKVGNTYLYENDLPREMLDQNTDSLLQVNKFIDDWALREILIKKATYNIPTAEQEKFDQLIQNYKYELYIKAYKDALIAERLKNYAPSQDEIKQYYEKHHENFRLNENLLQLRYIDLSKTLYNLNEIKEKFFSFNQDDILFLEQRSLEFRNYSFNDSVWVKELDVLKQINHKAKRINSNELALQNKFEIEDSLGLILIQVVARKKLKEQAPISYVKPTIEQILLNKKKIELRKKIDKEVIEYAIENNEYKKFD